MKENKENILRPIGWLLRYTPLHSVSFSKTSPGVDQCQPAGLATVRRKLNGSGITRKNCPVSFKKHFLS